MCNTFASLFFAVLLCIASLFFLVVNWVFCSDFGCTSFVSLQLISAAQVLLFAVGPGCASCGFLQLVFGCASWASCSCFGCASFDFCSLFRLHEFCFLQLVWAAQVVLFTVGFGCASCGFLQLISASRVLPFAVGFGCASFDFCSWSRLCELWLFAIDFCLRKLDFLQLFRLREFWMFALDFCCASFVFCSWFWLWKLCFLQLVPVVWVVAFCGWFLSAQVDLFAVVLAARVLNFCPWFLLRAARVLFLQLVSAVEALLFAVGPGCASCGFLQLIFRTFTVLVRAHKHRPLVHNTRISPPTHIPSRKLSPILV